MHQANFDNVAHLLRDPRVRANVDLQDIHGKTLHRACRTPPTMPDPGPWAYSISNGTSLESCTHPAPRLMHHSMSACTSSSGDVSTQHICMGICFLVKSGSKSAVRRIKQVDLSRSVVPCVVFGIGHYDSAHARKTCVLFHLSSRQWTKYLISDRQTLLNQNRNPLYQL